MPDYHSDDSPAFVAVVASSTIAAVAVAVAAAIAFVVVAALISLFDVLFHEFFVPSQPTGSKER